MRIFPSDLALPRACAVGLILVLMALTPALASGQDQGPTLIVLVRHAERAGPSAEDPPLTVTGDERAQALARLLDDAGITQIHASDTRRTRETARPLATTLGLEIEQYDPRDLEGFAAHLLSLPGRHLVVGHSNTTDELAVFLGGTSHGPIAEAWEYDRAYLLTPRPEGGMETVVLRFGPVPDRS
jgi:phosphohistidine phosphatase SixA